MPDCSGFYASLCEGSGIRRRERGALTQLTLIPLEGVVRTIFRTCAEPFTASSRLILRMVAISRESFCCWVTI